jgi:hypothetical protein
VSSEPPIVAAGTPPSRWTNNFAMTVGASIAFKR